MAEKQLPPKLFNLDATIGLQSTSFISLNRQRDEHQGGGGTSALCQGAQREGREGSVLRWALWEAGLELPRAEEPGPHRWQRNMSSSQRTRTQSLYLVLVWGFSASILYCSENHVCQQVETCDHRAERGGEWPVGLGVV